MGSPKSADEAEPIHIVFCCDRGVLTGLFCAAFSVVENASRFVSITIFSNDLVDEDVDRLRRCLQVTGNAFSLTRRTLDVESLSEFPTLNNSHAAYFRILAAQSMEVDRFVYLDADLLCGLDIEVLANAPLGDSPIGWIPEAPLAECVDRQVALELEQTGERNYFNSGVFVVNVPAWNRLEVSSKAMKYLADHQPDFHDQSALNVVVACQSTVLPDQFNRLCNQRANWPHLVKGYRSMECIAHAVDYPKPWSPLAKNVHPQFFLWHEVITRIAEAGFGEVIEMTGSHGWLTPLRWNGYKKAVKDRLLFSLYRRGWLQTIKGIKELEEVR